MHDLRYSVGGEGTEAEPAYIGFAFRTRAPRLQWLKELFPASVVLEEDHADHFVLKGVSSTMSRLALTRVFFDVLRAQNWVGLGEDA